MSILKEAKRLFDLGFGVHWLGKNSKVPVKEGWTTLPRDEWETLEREYSGGETPRQYNLGVRTGHYSPLAAGGYLANIDVDLKGGEEFLAPALVELEKNFPGVWESAPLVKTGLGYRLFVRTEEPLHSVNVFRTKEKCRVRLPGSRITDKARDALIASGTFTAEEIKAGWRIRPNWEIDAMSAGKQVVVPPSRHPETGRKYLWARPLGVEALPLVKWHSDKRQIDTSTETASDITQKFEPVNVDIHSRGLHPGVVAKITDCTGVSDRSAVMLGVTLAMLDAGFSDVEILSVLTDKGLALGVTAYEHDDKRDARKGDRPRWQAARWVDRFTLQPAKAMKDPKSYFTESDDAAATVEAAPTLPADEAERQLAELTAGSWRDELKRHPATDKNPNPAPKKSLENTVLVLTNDERLGKSLFRRDLFAVRDSYGLTAPWVSGKAGEAVTDDCVAHMTLYLGRTYNFEPAERDVLGAVRVIATDNGYHPIRDELEALPKWDGKHRLDTWLAEHFGARVPKYVEEENDVIRLAGRQYLAQVFRKWLVASVTRVYEPGAKIDWMPIFQGKQGTGKSSFAKILFGRAYTSDWLPQLHDKDAAAGLRGIRCHEFSELESLKKNEIETIKAFVTREVDRFRPSYGKLWVESPRQCVFCGTTNRDTYLKDETGNRRFNPLEVGYLNFRMLERDRDQLWAEALHLYRNRLERSLDLEGEAATVASDARLTKMVEDESAFMTEALIRWLDRGAPMTPLMADEGERHDRFKLVSLFGVGGPLNPFPQKGRAVEYAAKALKGIGATRFGSNGQHWWKLSEYDREKLGETVSPKSVEALEADLDALYR